MKGFTSNEVSIMLCCYVLDSLLVNTKSLNLYFGLKFELKYNKTNTNTIYSSNLLRTSFKLKSNNENMIKIT
jgi:hypothetical protein